MNKSQTLGQGLGICVLSVTRMYTEVWEPLSYSKPKQNSSFLIVSVNLDSYNTVA